MSQRGVIVVAGRLVGRRAAILHRWPGKASLRLCSRFALDLNDTKVWALWRPGKENSRQKEQEHNCGVFVKEKGKQCGCGMKRASTSQSSFKVILRSLCFTIIALCHDLQFKNVTLRALWLRACVWTIWRLLGSHGGNWWWRLCLSWNERMNRFFLGGGRG